MREKDLNKIEVQVAGIIFHEGRFLVAKRAPNRALFPNLWECGGGHMKEDETFHEALKRQMREEFGVMIEPLKILGTYEITTVKPKIPGITYLCKLIGYVNEQGPVISEEHTEYKWIPPEEIKTLEFIPKVKETLEKAHRML